MAIALRPLSIGELLDRTFSLYRNHFVLFVGIMALPQLVVFAITLSLVATPFLVPKTSPGLATAGLIGFLIMIPVLLLGYVAAYGMSNAATVYAVSQVYLERRTTITESYRFVMRRFWPVILVTILIGIGAIVGLFALIIGALFVVVFCALAIPATVLEGLDPIASIQRSINLVKDDIGRILLILILFVAINYAASLLVSVPTMTAMMVYTVKGGTPPVWLTAVQYLGSFLVGTIVGPLMTIALSLVYYDERVRKEAFDLQLMMATVDRNAVASSAVSAVPPSP